MSTALAQPGRAAATLLHPPRSSRMVFIRPTHRAAYVASKRRFKMPRKYKAGIKTAGFFKAPRLERLDRRLEFYVRSTLCPGPASARGYCAATGTMPMMISRSGKRL